MSLFAYFWCSSCTSHPRTSQVPIQIMHMFRGRMCYNLTPLRLTCLLSTREIASKGYWKGKVNLDKERASTALRNKCIFSQVRTNVLIAFSSYLTLWWGNGVKGPKVLLFWCLMPKGEKLRPKQMDQPTTWEISKICSKPSYCKNYSLMGEKFDYGKKGEFVAFDQIYSWKISWFTKTSVFDIEIEKRICFVKINQVVAKVIQICQIQCEIIWSSICTL
jgi:hypothetical protein